MDYNTFPLVSPVWTEGTPYKRTLCPRGTRQGYVSGKVGDHERAVREDCEGWSVAAALRYQNKLMAVDPLCLPKHARAMSLTFGVAPASAALMHIVRVAYLKRLLRRGLCLATWHCEFQPRIKYKTGGVPHFHMAAFWDLPPPSPEELARIWLSVSREYNTSIRGQYVLPVYDLDGWFAYQSKHGARGVSHYQRLIEHAPPGWKTKTGRMWGFRSAPGYEWKFSELPLFCAAAVSHRERDLNQLEIIADARCKIARRTGSHFTGFRNGTIPRRCYVVHSAIKNSRGTDGIKEAISEVNQSLSNITRGRNIKQTTPPAVQKRIDAMFSEERLKRYRSAKNGYERRRVLPARVKRFKKGFSSCRGMSLFSKIPEDKFYASMVYHRGARPGFIKNFQTEFNIMDNVASSMETKQ